MSRVNALALVAVLAGAFANGGQQAWASAPAPAPGPPALTTSFDTVALSSFWMTSTSCSTVFVPSGQAFVSQGCVHADGAARLRPRLDQRVKAAFRGTVTLTLPENTDSVLIAYGRQPAVEYTTRPAVIWPTPGSGIYHMTITIKWHDESTRSEATYSVPLWVPRRQY
jgi:hypothetical protein